MEGASLWVEASRPNRARSPLGDFPHFVQESSHSEDEGVVLFFFCFSYRCYCFAIISTLRPPPLHQQWKGLAHGLDCQQQQQTNKRPEMDCPDDRSWPFELTSESAGVPVHDVQDRQRYRPTQPSFDGLID